MTVQLDIHLPALFDRLPKKDVQINDSKLSFT